MRTGAEIIYKDLLKWAKQIASGMTHLENKNVTDILFNWIYC